MESQPQNPEFRNDPENFHPWVKSLVVLLPVKNMKAYNRSV